MELVLTSSACPEQYSLRDDNGAEIGFFRLRHGHFRAEDGSGRTIYEASDLISDGVFEGSEREERMLPAIDLVLAAHGLRRHDLAAELLAATRSALARQLDDWDDPSDDRPHDFDDACEEGIQ
ncbi:hypothetical protein AB0I24_15410 [Brachybacterium paraconglomeratum]